MYGIYDKGGVSPSGSEIEHETVKASEEKHLKKCVWRSAFGTKGVSQVTYWVLTITRY